MAGTTAYPGALDTNTNLNENLADNVDTVAAAHQNNQNAAIKELQKKVGIGADTATNHQILVGGASAGSSAWVTMSGNATITNAGVVSVTGITTGAAPLYVNETANAKSTIGITINQAANDNEILAFKSSDIDHDLTTLGSETDTYAAFQKSHATIGGLQITSIADDAALASPTVIKSFGGTATTAKTTSGVGLIDLYAAEHDGSDTVANITSDGNIFSVRAKTGGSDLTKFLVDEDGDAYIFGNAVVTGTVSAGGSTLAAAGSKSMVASGAIGSAGLAVALNADGTVSTIADNRSDGSRPSTGVQYEAADAEYNVCGYNEDTGGVWVAYFDRGAGGDPTVCAGTVSGSTITWGTAVAIENIDGHCLGAAYDKTLNQLWVVYSDKAASDYNHRITSCTFSGTTTTKNGTEKTVRTGNSNAAYHDNQVFYNATDGVTIAAITDGNNNDRTDFYKLSISGSTITATASSDTTTAGGHHTGTYYARYDWDETNDRIIRVYFRADQLYYEAYSYNNSTPTVARTVGPIMVTDGEKVKSTAKSHSINYDDSNKVTHLMWRADLEDTLFIRALKLSGTDLKLGPRFVGSRGPTTGNRGVTSTYPPLAYMVPDALGTGRILLTYNSNDDYTRIVPLGIGQNLEYKFAGAEQTMSYTSGTGTAGHWAAAGHFTAGKMIICWSNNNGNNGVGNIYTMPTGATTAPNFFGISEAAISDTATGSITIVGGVNTGVSGLTRGDDIYLTAAGAYSSTASAENYGKIGTATAANNILLTGTGDQAVSDA